MYVLSILVVLVIAAYVLQMTDVKENFSQYGPFGPLDIFGSYGTYGAYGRYGSQGYPWRASMTSPAPYRGAWAKTSGWGPNWWSNWWQSGRWFDRTNFPDGNCPPASSIAGCQVDSQNRKPGCCSKPVWWIY